MATPVLWKAHEVRTIVENGVPIFCAADVCEVLGYANGRQALADHCRPEGVSKRYTLTKGGNQELLYLTEANLYRLIMKSTMPDAQQFEEWVMGELLPSLRAQGSLGAPIVPASPTTLAASNDDPIMAMIGVVVEMRKEQIVLEKRVDRLEELRARGRSPQDMRIRKACSALSKQIARKAGEWPGVVMSDAYAALELRFGIDLRVFASDGFASKIDWIEGNGFISHLHDILRDMQ